MKSNEHVFQGVIGNHNMLLRQTVSAADESGNNTVLEFFSSSKDRSIEAHIKSKLNELFYFKSCIDISALKEQWCLSCPYFAIASKSLPGLRILRQEPFECLISFLTSSNNNIKRISSLLSKLRTEYGTLLPKLESKEYETINTYSFPNLAQLSKATEAKLRSLGFGYRAKYICKTVAQLKERGGSKYLLGLRESDDLGKVREELIGLHGIGRKVADCVMLFSLDFPSIVPVDTHVRKIAQKRYGAKLGNKTKTLTEKDHEIINSIFVNKFGPYAGWAHSFLFAADLPLFKEEVARNSPKKRKPIEDTKMESPTKLFKI